MFTCTAVAEKQVQFKWKVGTTEQDASLYENRYTTAERLSSSVLTLRNLQSQDTTVICQAPFTPDTIRYSNSAKLTVIS